MDLYKKLQWFFEELKEYKELLEKPESELPEHEYPFLPKDLQRNSPKFKNVRESLREKLVEKSGALGQSIEELTGLRYIQLPATGEVKTIWAEGLTTFPSPYRESSLDKCLDATKEAMGKLKSDIEKGKRDKQGDLTGKTQGKSNIEKAPINLFDALKLHPKIVNASRALFEDEYYAEAIFAAFKAVENFVQDKSGLTLYGTNLMERVFNEENPIIKVPEAGHYYKEVQKGFKHLFIGASQGIRNPKAHKEIIQKDPYITLHYLGFFSFLLKRIDYWKADIS